MPIERDPESTKFDHRPWGGQQRLVPLAARFARGTDAPTPQNEELLAASAQPAVTRPLAAAKAPAVTRPVVINASKGPAPRPVVINPAKPAKADAVTRAIVAAAPAAPATRPATAIEEAPDFRSRPTQDSLPVARVSNPVEVDTEVALPSLGTTASMSAPVEPLAMPVLTPVPGTLPPAPSTSLPTVAMMRAADVSTDVNPAQPAFVPVVQYPAVAMYAAPMPAPALAVSAARAPRQVPAFSVKEGRALGGFVVPHIPKVCEVFRNEDATIAVRRRPLTARSIIAIPVGAVIATAAILMIYLAQPAQAKTASMASSASAPQVMTVVAEPPVVMNTVTAAPIAPVVLSAPVAASEPVVVPAIEKAEKSSRHRSRSSRHKKPRRITAVDASTPLGNLRVDDLERP